MARARSRGRGRRGPRGRNQSRAQGRKRSGAPSSRLALPKKPRIDETELQPTAPSILLSTPSPPDTSQAELSTLKTAFDSLTTSDGVSVPSSETLQLFTNAVVKHGAEKTLLAVPSAPRAILGGLVKPLRRTEQCRSLAASLVAVACDSGDGEAAKRGRKWAASVLTTAVRGNKSTLFAHGAAPSVAAGVAPRDALDGAAGRLLARRFADSLDASQFCDRNKIVNASIALTPVLDVRTALPAIEALLHACVRVQVSLEGESEENDEILLPGFIDKLMECTFHNLRVTAQGALLASHMSVCKAVYERVCEQLEVRLFAPLAVEESLCESLGIGAMHSICFHWQLMDDAVEAAKTEHKHPFARRTWKGRRAKRAISNAAWRSCNNASDVSPFSARLPRRSRGLVTSLNAFGQGATVSSRSGKACTDLLRLSLNCDESRTLLCCEHPLELSVIASGSSLSNVAPVQVLGEARYGLDAMLSAGRVAGGVMNNVNVRKVAKDPVVSSELLRALAIAAKYCTQWVNLDALGHAASELLTECRKIHRKDDQACKDIDETARWWAELYDTVVT